MSPVLIGDGGHARDIWHTIHNRSAWTRYAHHQDWDADGTPYILGINDPQLRSQIADGYGYGDQPWQHPTALIGPDCTWGAGTHINYYTSMTRTVIGEHCTIAPGVTICGDVQIGDRVFIGAGAVIVNLTVVPDGTFIKAGTVWTAR